MHATSNGRPGPMTIDCGTCRMQHSPACSDCVVTFLVGRGPDDALVVEAAEFAALRRLGRAGLVPELRHDRRTG
jgi:hypothetical protein